MFLILRCKTGRNSQGGSQIQIVVFGAAVVISTSSLSLMLLLFLKYHHLSWKNYFPHDFHSFTLVQVFIGGMVCAEKPWARSAAASDRLGVGVTSSSSRRRHKVEGQKSVALEKFIIIWQKLEKVAAWFICRLSCQDLHLGKSQLKVEAKADFSTLVFQSSQAESLPGASCSLDGGGRCAQYWRKAAARDFLLALSWFGQHHLVSCTVVSRGGKTSLRI